MHSTVSSAARWRLLLNSPIYYPLPFVLPHLSRRETSHAGAAAGVKQVRASRSKSNVSVAHLGRRRRVQRFQRVVADQQSDFRVAGRLRGHGHRQARFADPRATIATHRPDADDRRRRRRRVAAEHTDAADVDVVVRHATSGPLQLRATAEHPGGREPEVRIQDAVQEEIHRMVDVE